MNHYPKFQVVKSSCSLAVVDFSATTKRFCFIFALLAHLLLCNPATALQINVGATDASGKVWSSISHPALATEAILQAPVPATLLGPSQFSDAVEVLRNMGIDVDVTSSATDDSLAMDDEWEVDRNVQEIGELLRRYLREKNAVYEVTKSGTVKIISMDEMDDDRYFQTIVYRVNHLAGNYQELVVLKQQIQDTFTYAQWEDNGGSSSISPRLQGGHRILMVSTHYHYHVRFRQLLHELTTATAGLPTSHVTPAPSRIFPSRSTATYAPARSPSNRQHSSRLIALPTWP